MVMKLKKMQIFHEKTELIERKNPSNEESQIDPKNVKKCNSQTKEAIHAIKNLEKIIVKIYYAKQINVAKKAGK